MNMDSFRYIVGARRLRPPSFPIFYSGKKRSNVQLTPQMYLIVLPMVFIAALVDAIGGGGGLISLPAYTLAGLPYDVASGCNKFSACFGTLSATLRFWRSGKIRWMPALFAIIGALPGAYVGTRISMMLPEAVKNIIMICAIPMVGVFIALKKEKKDSAEKPLTRLRLLICFAMGLLLGMYDGFFGPGMGTFLILVLNMATGMDMVSASATAKPVNLASGLSSLITRICAGQVIFALALPAMALSVTGGWVGSKLALTKGARLIRYVMLGVLALLVVTLILKTVG